jgi:hypothetical protein
MPGKESSIARRPPAGAALGPPLEVDALERAAAVIRPSWSDLPSIEVHPSAFEPSGDARASDADALGRAPTIEAPHPGLASAPAALAPGGADATWHMPAAAPRGLGPDDSTDTDLPLIGASRRVLRNMLVVTALGVGAGLAVMFVRATQPLPAPRPVAAPAPTASKPAAAAPSQPEPAAPVPTAPLPSAAAAAPEPAPAEARAEETVRPAPPPEARAEETVRPALPPARAAAGEPSDADLARIAKRLAKRSPSAPQAKPAKKSGSAPKARAKRAPKHATTPAPRFEAGYVNDNPY